MIDIGMVIIQVKGGGVIVARCESDGDQVQLVPAANAEQLAEQAVRVVTAQDGTLDEDGCYLCSDELQEGYSVPPWSRRPPHAVRRRGSRGAGWRGRRCPGPVNRAPSGPAGGVP